MVLCILKYSPHCDLSFLSALGRFLDKLICQAGLLADGGYWNWSDIAFWKFVHPTFSHSFRFCGLQELFFIKLVAGNIWSDWTVFFFFCCAQVSLVTEASRCLKHVNDWLTWRSRSEAGLIRCWNRMLSALFCCSRSNTRVRSFRHSSLRSCGWEELVAHSVDGAFHEAITAEGMKRTNLLREKCLHDLISNLKEKNNATMNTIWLNSHLCSTKTELQTRLSYEHTRAVYSCL